MKALNTTVAASLSGTAVGLVAWASGFGQVMWPAHPQMADFLATLVTTIVVQTTGLG